MATLAEIHNKIWTDAEYQEARTHGYVATMRAVLKKHSISGSKEQAQAIINYEVPLDHESLHISREIGKDLVSLRYLKTVRRLMTKRSNKLSTMTPEMRGEIKAIIKGAMKEQMRVATLSR